MTDRIIDLSDAPARLSVRQSQLVIERHDHAEVTMPIAEIAVLIVAHRQVVYTHAVLAGLAGAGGAFITCDEHHMPIGMMLPITGHHLQTERFGQQAQASLPSKKRVWQQLVQAKVSVQGRLLKELHGNDHGLLALADKVRSGDPDNIEAVASHRYWPALFADPTFRRDREATDQNALLNYGYAVLRAAVARAICAAGLHPSLGVHHHNRYDAFCLADDLIEPFRPIVDRAVAQYVWEKGAPPSLDKQAKARILAALTGRSMLDGESRTLFDIAAHTAVSLSRVYAGQAKELALPHLRHLKSEISNLKSPGTSQSKTNIHERTAGERNP
jgi:CRISPR-associated protein Cas1